MPTTTTHSSSPRCGAFFANLRCNGGGGGGGAEQGTRRSPCGVGGGVGGCARLDRVAAWVGGGVAAAFFASLERCSCVRVPADDDRRDDPRDAAAAPLLISHPHPQLRTTTTTRAKGN